MIKYTEILCKARAQKLVTPQCLVFYLLTYLGISNRNEEVNIIDRRCSELLTSMELPIISRLALWWKVEEKPKPNIFIPSRIVLGGGKKNPELLFLRMRWCCQGRMNKRDEERSLAFDGEGKKIRYRVIYYSDRRR